MIDLHRRARDIAMLPFAGAVHVLAQNPSATEPTRFMAIHVADDGAQLTVYH